MGAIILYEGNDGTQDVVDVFSDKVPQLPRPLKKNDEARSLVLAGVRPGTLIWVADSPNGTGRENWTRIEVLAEHAWYVVPSFQKTYDDQYVTVEHKPRRGKKPNLDGKVSSIRIDRSSTVVP